MDVHEQARLEERFHAAMIDIYFEAKRQVKYAPSRFLQKVRSVGGLAGAHEFLQSEHISHGLTELLSYGRPDLTMEALVLRPEFRPLFARAELNAASQRLGLSKIS